MAYNYNYIKLTWGGTMADQEEIWTCGMHLALANGVNLTTTDFAALGLDLEEISDVVSALHSDIDVRIPSGAVLEWTKIALIGTDGKYELPPVEYIFPAGINGGANNGYVPQVAMVGTLVSFKYKDPGKYNRFYLPASGFTTSGTYKLSSGATSTAAAAIADFITGINAISTLVNETLVVRCVGQNLDHYSEARAVRVGDVLDTQRRRRNKITETYAEEDIAV